MASAGDGESILEDVPWSDGITAYDEAHFAVYLRLLDADADGAHPDEMARIVLGIDSAKEPTRAQKALSSHLRRARWMTEHGYRRLIGRLGFTRASGGTGPA